MYHTIRTCFECENGKLHLFENSPKECYDMNLQIQETNKAMISYEMELFTYYLAENYPRYEEGPVYTKEYEDILAILEFYLNRLTSCNDDTIGELMTNLRFSLTNYMKITAEQVKDVSDSGRYRHYTTRDRYSKNMDLRNICCYEAPLFTVKDLEHIDKLEPKDRTRVAEGFKHAASNDESINNFDYSFIVRNSREDTRDSISSFLNCIKNTVDGNLEGPSLYVRVSEGPLMELSDRYWNSGDSFQKDTRKKYIPLKELITYLENVIEMSPHFLGSQIYKDLEDMRENHIRPYDVLLAEIGERDSDLESTDSTPADVYKRMEDKCQLNDLIKMAIFIRAVHSIFSGSKVDKTGSTKYISLKFSIKSLMRLLDPEIFGKISFSDMVIVSDDNRMYDEYCRYLIKDVGFKYDDETGAFSREYDLSGIQTGWGSSGRQKERALPTGCISHIRSIRKIKCDDAVNILPKLNNNSVILVDKKNLDLVETMAGGLKKAGKKNIRFIIIKGDDSFVSVNENIDDVIEVGVKDCKESLYNVHSNGIVIKRQMASAKTIEAICMDCKIELDKDGIASQLLEEKISGITNDPYESIRNTAVKEFLELSRSLTESH
ncbi:MAG: hypothetical protein KRP56_07600 [Candidatus Methanogranum gryphiswaldense]|nr:MAG: hypothetical protein KRP56_07600 [Candidatus Methanogranum sp. U3.2.1]